MALPEIAPTTSVIAGGTRRPRRDDSARITRSQTHFPAQGRMVFPVAHWR